MQADKDQQDTELVAALAESLDIGSAGRTGLAHVEERREAEPVPPEQATTEDLLCKVNHLISRVAELESLALSLIHI